MHDVPSGQWRSMQVLALWHYCTIVLQRTVPKDRTCDSMHTVVPYTRHTSPTEFSTTPQRFCIDSEYVLSFSVPFVSCAPTHQAGRKPFGFVLPIAHPLTIRHPSIYTALWYAPAPRSSYLSKLHLHNSPHSSKTLRSLDILGTG